MMNSRYALLTLSLASILCGCAPQQEVKTLAALDVAHNHSEQSDVFVPYKTEEEIKQAYYAYLESAKSNDKTRLLAMGRLAEMEIEKANAALKQSQEPDSDDRIYLESLRRTRELLQTSLRDYPQDPGNDRVFYRLARIEDQLGEPENSLRALRQLTENHPDSVHYAEAQFRLGERAFLERDYISAEDAYTEVINTLNNGEFRQRAYFKRGWARYKQGIYTYAADDHLQAIREHGYRSYQELDENMRGIFEEHFRALALTFAQAGDRKAMAEFFRHEPEHEYYYHTSRALSQIYRDQERFSDAAAVLGQYVSDRPTDKHSATAQLQVADIWKQAGFRSQYLDAIEAYYASYAPDSAYWQENQADTSVLAETLKDHIVYTASYYHSEFLKRTQAQTAEANSDTDPVETVHNAIRWYERYLENFSDQARKDAIYIRYADLLAANNQLRDALEMYEMAAYDGTVIIDKTAAYATITLSYQLYKANPASDALLGKHLQYATRFAQLYPEDSETGNLALHAAEAAFLAGRYDEAVALSNIMQQPQVNPKLAASARLIKARSLLELNHLTESEELLLEILREAPKDQAVIDNLALTIYRKGEAAHQAGNIKDAVNHYARLTSVVPSADIAAQSLYDAIVVAMDNQLWDVALRHMRTFETQFPNDTKVDDVIRHQSIAYMQAEKYAEAAEALEKVSAKIDNTEVQMAALWQAAEIYEKQGDTDAAIRTYRSYAHTYNRPYPQYVEAMHKLTQIYSSRNDEYRRNFWEQKIVDAERTVPQSVKTERTNFIAASTWLALAHRKKVDFENIQLAEPLAENLRRKKAAMQEAIDFYSQASTYNDGNVSTQSTYSIASIYRHFAQALLDSERPSHLTGDQRIQYDILIEDQAFPFEEMAIEFHEINVSRIKNGLVNRWVTSSLDELRALFPVRYARDGKLHASTVHIE